MPQVNEEVDANKSAEALLAAQHQVTEAHAANAAKSAQLADLLQQLGAAQNSERATLGRLQACRSVKEGAAKQLEVFTVQYNGVSQAHVTTG